jgi:hypothetical protein
MEKVRSSKELESMLQRVRRFDSAEFISVLENMPKRAYVVYGANGYGAVRKAVNAVKALKPKWQFADRAINKNERAIIRL